MASPFPGMDPYIERPDHWPDFHDRLITYIAEGLQRRLKPKYVALVQDRVYVAESGRLVRPDVAVARTRQGVKPGAGSSARTATTLEPDPAKVVALEIEDIREPLIQIVEPSNTARVVTAIEVLSPKNKRPGPGRRSYLQKRKELWRAGTNLVEIDLLREGRPTAWGSQRPAEGTAAFHYSVVVTRKRPPQHEFYERTMRDRLPRVAVPLGKGDPDVTLDLQAAFNRCWDEGPYPELLAYGGPPPGRMGEADIAWCVELLREKQLR
jgi:hypothetical protein